jgi:class 3 adenylate cyclase
MPQTEVYSIYPETSNVTWFGGDDGLIRYDGNIKYGYNMEFHALIRKVILERDSVLFGGVYYHEVSDSGEYIGHSLSQPEELKSEISYAFNSITFEYAAPSYYDEKSKYYKVYLEGFDKKWSGWANETKKEYTNLPPGTYKFHVIAKNIFDTESSEAIYEFKILSPWYRTWFAYFIYVIAFAFIIYLAIQFSNRRLREAKLRLEEVIKDRTNDLNKQKKELEKEKEKADKLLLNILPFKIADELKTNGNAKTKSFEQVTVMFSDFKDFTVIAQQMEPQELISELNRCFIFFDDVCTRHNIEKIKTIGDSYMCAGGIPMKNKTNPVDMVLAAFEIRDFISRLKKEQAAKGHTLWKIRIGIHTGPIISGVVGKKKFAYDIWGDTVNTASRLEQTSLPNQINISGVTYKLVKDFFDCTYRGKIPVKHKGEIDMNFVEKIKKELSVDEEGKMPNQKFWELYETLKYK